MATFLISVDVIKAKGFVNSNVEAKMMSVALTRAQDLDLRPILGTSLYKRLLEGVTANDLNADEQNLLDNYITPVLIAAVDLRITTPLAIQTRAKTVGTSQDQQIRTADEREFLKLQDSLRTDLNEYRTILIGFLRDNYELYPQYANPECSFENVKPGRAGSGANISFV